MKPSSVGRMSIAAGAVVLAMVALAGEAPRKKVIAHGWDLLSASTEDVHRNRAKFADTGYDGIAMPLDIYDSARRRHSGLFLDAAFDSLKGEPWDAGELGGSRVAKLLEKTIEAGSVADDLIWVYGQRGQLIDWDRTYEWGTKRLKSYPLWEDALPGRAATCRAAVDDVEGYASAVERAGWSLTNVMENSSCKSVDGKSLPYPKNRS